MHKEQGLNTSMSNMIRKIISEQTIKNQNELSATLTKVGIEVNQSTLSRALKRMNVTKVDGVYQFPEIISDNSDYFEFLKIISAGDHMLVVKTSPGSASRVAYQIDGAGINGIAGTISGDDAIFVAIADTGHKPSIIQDILQIFKSEKGS